MRWRAPGLPSAFVPTRCLTMLSLNSETNRIPPPPATFSCAFTSTSITSPRCGRRGARTSRIRSWPHAAAEPRWRDGITAHLREDRRHIQDDDVAPARRGGHHRAQPGARHQLRHRGPGVRPQAVPGHHRAGAPGGGHHRGRARPHPPRSPPDRDHPPAGRRGGAGEPLHRPDEGAIRTRPALGVPAVELHTGPLCPQLARGRPRARELRRAAATRTTSASPSTPGTASRTST